ncbi:MAG: hypothetical protein GF370_00965 [Candidatus Nealsonbacteria bacterium]|nr:hypothetical protein [Candidatus Nealsonbacteria bacterium]
MSFKEIEKKMNEKLVKKEREEEIQRVMEESLKPSKLSPRIIKTRERARENGIIAEKLKDLKDEDGNSFTEDSGYYWCYSFSSGHGCGFVKGSPIKEKFNNLNFFSSSVGWDFYCRVCGQKIGSRTTSRR